MNKDKRREKRKKITMANGKGPSNILAKGLDWLTQQARMAAWIGVAPVLPKVHYTNSREPFLSVKRQYRKGICAKHGITMKQFRKLSKKARHEGVNPPWVTV